MEMFTPKLSTYQRLLSEATVSAYSLSTCATLALLLYILILVVVLVYFLIFINRDKSSYDGKDIAHFYDI